MQHMDGLSINNVGGYRLDSAGVPAIAARVAAYGQACANRCSCYSTACRCRSRNKFGAIKDGRHVFSHRVMSEATCIHSFDEPYLDTFGFLRTDAAGTKLCIFASSWRGLVKVLFR